MAFGPPKDDYKLLQQMAAVLPGSSFQKLGLSAAGLTSCFSSFSSTLTNMRTSLAAGSVPMTLRMPMGDQGAKRFYETMEVIEHGDDSSSGPDTGWRIYTQVYRSGSSPMIMGLS